MATTTNMINLVLHTLLYYFEVSNPTRTTTRKVARSLLIAFDVVEVWLFVQGLPAYSTDINGASVKCSTFSTICKLRLALKYVCTELFDFCDVTKVEALFTLEVTQRIVPELSQRVRIAQPHLRSAWRRVLIALPHLREALSHAYVALRLVTDPPAPQAVLVENENEEAAIRQIVNSEDADTMIERVYGQDDREEDAGKVEQAGTSDVPMGSRVRATFTADIAKEILKMITDVNPEVLDLEAEEYEDAVVSALARHL